MAAAATKNSFGWQLQGYIEDEAGRLRLQTEDEHRFCMGCHSAVGVTVDQTFTLARKVPGADGWGHQELTGIPDVPQLGHDQPEILTYFERVTGGDEFRANKGIQSCVSPDWRRGGCSCWLVEIEGMVTIGAPAVEC